MIISSTSTSTRRTILFHKNQTLLTIIYTRIINTRIVINYNNALTTFSGSISFLFLSFPYFFFWYLTSSPFSTSSRRRTRTFLILINIWSRSMFTCAASRTLRRWRWGRLLGNCLFILFTRCHYFELKINILSI